LGGNALLAGLSAQTRFELNRRLRPVRYDRGQAIGDGDRLLETVDFPTSGVIAMVVGEEDGRSLDTALIGREGVVGAPAWAAGEASFGRAIVRRPGAGLRIDAAALRALCSIHDDLRSALDGYAARLLRDLHEAVGCAAMHDVERRLAGRLLRYADPADGDTLHLSQEELAAALGVQRTTINAVVQRLRDRGALRSGRGRIRLDREALATYACRCGRRVEG
jgi:CRP-like cAMP-binding protein